MAISPIVPVRLKPEDVKILKSIQKFARFSTRSDTVRQLIRTGINFYQTRGKAIKEIKEQVGVFTIRPEEIFEGIRYKRKFLDFKDYSPKGELKKVEEL